LSLEISRWLRLIGLAQLSSSATASLAPRRMAMRMCGGKLAVALPFLTFYTLLRGALVLIQAGQRMSLLEGQSASVSCSLFIGLCWQAASWTAPPAVAHRAEMTVNGAREPNQQCGAKAVLASA
jgi:hypothetical protein